MAKKESQKNVHAKALGHLGGLKGGPARAKVLSKQRREAIARQGALAKKRKEKLR